MKRGAGSRADDERLLRKRVYQGMSLDQARAAEAEHRRRMSVLTGLLLAQFVGMMANTIIGNAMPVIVAEIGGNQAQYAWVMTAGMLANTVTTPIAGKLSDLFDKKRLFMAGMVIFGIGSLLCGAAWSPESLIGFRILQGIGMGLQVTLTMTILATIIPPRERGRYNGYQGAVMALATVSGPLVGGLIVDIPWLGWRWCFWTAIPLVLVTLVVVGRSLHVPHVRKENVRVDVVAAALVAAAASTFLLWISNAGRGFDWVSVPSALMVAGALVAVVLLVLWERRHPEPLLPLDLLANRTTVLAVIASTGLGVMMFGSNVFLGQYFQYGLGYSPTAAGLLGLPMMVGVLVASTTVGRMTSARGTWKWSVVWGTALMSVGTIALAFVRQDTPYWVVAVALLAAGVGLGSSMQNLLLAVQNSIGLSQMGAATSIVTFFRTLAGAAGVQILGIVYGHAVNAQIEDELGRLPQAPAGASGALDLAALPDGVEEVVRQAYGDGIGAVFLTAAVVAVAGFVAACLMPPTDLRRTVDVTRPVPDDGPPPTR